MYVAINSCHYDRYLCYIIITKKEKLHKSLISHSWSCFSSERQYYKTAHWPINAYYIRRFARYCQAKVL